jgi:hypothetical protein
MRLSRFIWDRGSYAFIGEVGADETTEERLPFY